MKTAAKNQVQKLALRQVCGSLQPFSRSNPVRLFTKYSQKCCFKLSDILDKKGEIRDGHVILGFTKDGTHLISYSLVIDTRLELPQPVYTYTLHWWRFQYSKPLFKVQSATLFYDQPISHALHLIVSQSPDEKQVIVWGRGPTSKEEQTCRCYVTVCAAPPNKPCDKCKAYSNKPCHEHSYSAHIMYDSLPPYPVFLPSICLQIPGTVFFNSGDSLIAFKCVPCVNDFEVENAIHEFKNSHQLPGDLSGHGPSEVEEIPTIQKQMVSDDNNDTDCINLREGNKEDVDYGNGDEPCKTKKDSICELESLTTGLIIEQHDKNRNRTPPLVPSVSPRSSLMPSPNTSPMSSFGTILSTTESRLSCDSLTTYSYRKFTTPCDVQDNSFDTSDETVEVPALVMHGTQELESVIYSEHKGPNSSSGPSILVCQALLDMEQCISELIASNEDLYHRYKSLRDYDCQFLGVCEDTGDVIVMVKILMFAKPTRSSLSDGLQVSPSPLLQQTGFVFSWNVWNGTLQTLYCLETQDHPQGKSLSRSESTVEYARSLRQGTTVPVGFSSQVRVFSNYTVFTEKSLKYLLHPFLPIIIIL
ncbi:uncharacterized protein LOC116301698 [Actinia tenebrosa]|uniref:Uncharacterized protein LOC116301698 n=1 Tax=Actinia tenebrosa TaxID=6105 RepID=A0A6P8IJM5_ACTTE|nr:uncharacterized protein LOC116301698 [Actinia tenebrosa]